MVHDAARPLRDAQLWEAVILAAAATGGAIAVHATRASSNAAGRVVGWSGSRPLRRSASCSRRTGLRTGSRFKGTDTASCQYADVSIAGVEAPATNLKITFPEDVTLAERLSRASSRRTSETSLTRLASGGARRRLRRGTRRARRVGHLDGSRSTTGAASWRSDSRSTVSPTSPRHALDGEYAAGQTPACAYPSLAPGPRARPRTRPERQQHERDVGVLRDGDCAHMLPQGAAEQQLVVERQKKKCRRCGKPRTSVRAEVFRRPAPRREGQLAFCSLVCSARASSETRIWRALAGVRFSPADRPRSAPRRHRSRTTSATFITSPDAGFWSAL